VDLGLSSDVVLCLVTMIYDVNIFICLLLHRF